MKAKPFELKPTLGIRIVLTALCAVEVFCPGSTERFANEAVFTKART